MLFKVEEWRYVTRVNKPHKKVVIVGRNKKRFWFLPNQKAKENIRYNENTSIKSIFGVLRRHIR